MLLIKDRYGCRRGPEHHGGREGRKEGKGGKDLFRIGVVGNGSLNKTEGGREEGRKGRVKFVQGRCGWRRGPEQDGGREGGRKEREGRICSG